ncbi:hypothetical protein LIER_23980 [Lithospermum erythrorhizon]|uniref:Uncharacterized protein n=1 Tax=Lithospermum erythrorhizon TaxID=34254 RepID=A0AAV3QZP1_LITER
MASSSSVRVPQVDDLESWYMTKILTRSELGKWKDLPNIGRPLQPNDAIALHPANYHADGKSVILFQVFFDDE